MAQERAIRDDILSQAIAINTASAHQDLKKRTEAIKNASGGNTLQVGAAEYAAITQFATAFEGELISSDTSLKSKAAQLHANVHSQLRAWQTKAQATAQQVDAKKKSLESQGVKVDVAYFQKLANDEQRLTKDVANLNSWKPHRTALIAERNTCLKARLQCRERIATKRAAFATSASTALKAALTDLYVTLKFERSAHSPEANTIITEAMAWRTVQVPRATALTEGLTVPTLLTAIAKKEAAAITALKGEDGKSIFSAGDAALKPVCFRQQRALGRRRRRLTIQEFRSSERVGDHRAGPAFRNRDRMQHDAAGR